MFHANKTSALGTSLQCHREAYSHAIVVMLLYLGIGTHACLFVVICGKDSYLVLKYIFGKSSNTLPYI